MQPTQEVSMRSHALLVLCDVCRKTIPDEAAKEVIFQVDRLRYRLEMCSNCLDVEMGRRADRKWIPGFRKRTALTFVLDSADELPGRLGGTEGPPVEEGLSPASS
jgi:hypothetical protein